MINSKGERALAYITTIDDIEPITGADNIELAHIGGWRVIVKIGEFQKGDKGVYFEIDSKVPKEKRFEFLAKKDYKIKTMKLSKFGVVSQGLVMPLNVFPELKDKDVGEDVTQILRVKYSVAEDNERKSNSNLNVYYQLMKNRHPFIFKFRFVKWLMKRECGRNLISFFFGKKKDKPKEFPTFISKTDEERIENIPWRLDNHEKPWVVTEKLDGTSCTYVLKRIKKNKYEFYVCSRNVRQKDETQACYHDHNIYWDLAFKYDIEKHLTWWLDNHEDDEWVCIQGEGVGNVQGNPLKLKEDDLYIFNFITSSNGRFDSNLGKSLVAKWNMKWVPILGTRTLPYTMEEMKRMATGASQVNPDVLREGLVYRSIDGIESFKNVSNEYLLKHNA